MHCRGVWGVCVSVCVCVWNPLPLYPPLLLLLLLFVFGCNSKLRPRWTALKHQKEEVVASYRKPGLSGQNQFKSHLSHAIDVHHLSWLAAGPNKDSLIGKGWHAGSLIWGSQRGSAKVTESLVVLSSAGGGALLMVGFTSHTPTWAHT